MFFGSRIISHSHSEMDSGHRLMHGVPARCTKRRGRGRTLETFGDQAWNPPYLEPERLLQGLVGFIRAPHGAPKHGAGALGALRLKQGSRLLKDPYASPSSNRDRRGPRAEEMWLLYRHALSTPSWKCQEVHACAPPPTGTAPRGDQEYPWLL